MNYNGYGMLYYVMVRYGMVCSGMLWYVRFSTLRQLTTSKSHTLQLLEPMCDSNANCLLHNVRHKLQLSNQCCSTQSQSVEPASLFMTMMFIIKMHSL